MASQNPLRKVGPGKQKTKCIKVCDTDALSIPVKSNALRLVQLIWLDSRTVTLLTHSGAEAKFKI